MLELSQNGYKFTGETTLITLEFLLTALIVVLIPGTGVIYTISTGLIHKTKYSIAAAIGCTLGIVPHLGACIAGLSAIMNMSARMFVLIKLLGAAYLLYLAWNMWTHTESIDLSNRQKKPTMAYTIMKGIGLNIFNPKLTLFFFSFLPQFIPPQRSHATLHMMLLSAVFMALTLVVFIIYGVFASAISQYIATSTPFMKGVERGFAIIFAGLAVKLAFSEK